MIEWLSVENTALILKRHSNMKFIKNGKLEDKRIAMALHNAATDYENGELIEVRDLLLDIISAIDEFDSNEADV